MLEWLRLTFGHVPGAVIDPGDGVGVFATGIGHPFFNQIVTDDGATEAALGRAVDRVRDLGLRFYVVIRHPQDTGFRPLLERLGLQPDDELFPGMAADRLPPTATSPDELRIHVVNDRGGLADHATAVAGFGFPDEFISAFLGDDTWLIPDTTTYVGYVGGDPVASGFGVRTGRTIGVFSIATLPTARRRGYGAAMTGRILADGVLAGCDVGVLQASQLGRPIYERLGFRLVQEYAFFSD
jgi:GNAT superfamily N-acetyltransferase